jgi:hypothetical protein
MRRAMSNTTLNWEFRKIMKHMRKDARLQVLLAYILHANSRGRAWPSVDLLCKETGYKTAAVTASKQWLVETGALEPVEFSKRVNEEKDLHQRQTIMQITGSITIDEVSCQYLYNNEKRNISLSEILPSNISESETEVVTGSKVGTEDSSSNGKKPRKRDPMFDALVGVCKLDPKTAGSFIGKYKRLLIDAEYNYLDVIRFGEIWYTREFPGGKSDGKPPSPASVAKYIGWVKEDVDTSVSSWIPTAEEAAK